MGTRSRLDRANYPPDGRECVKREDSPLHIDCIKCHCLRLRRRGASKRIEKRPDFKVEHGRRRLHFAYRASDECGADR
jgi:hypothetical protein